MDSEGTTSGRPLDLRCEAIAPWLWRVSWAAGGWVATDAERERIAQVAASRASGALVVLVDVDPDGARSSSADPSGRSHVSPPRLVPVELQPITGGLGLCELESLVAAGALGDGRMTLYTSRGRGRVVMASWPSVRTADEQFISPLAPRLATQAFLARIDAVLAERAIDSVPKLPNRRPSLDDGELTPTRPDAARFEYVADGDDLFCELGIGGPFDRPALWIARLCRGGESFTLRPRVNRRPLERAQLVLVRATAAEDRGALLRVFLDDEDLGPWRLGDRQSQERPSFDLFRISSDLVAGRESLRLVFKLEGRHEIAALRWWFLNEEEPDGLWLTELEASSAERGTAPRADRKADGGLLIHGDELFLRGIELPRGSSVRYSLPCGERRLALSLARTDPRSKDVARLLVDVNGTTTRFELDSQRDVRRAISLPLSAADDGVLELTNDGDVPLLLLAPKLLR